MSTKLSPRVKDEWVNALLSGKYKQGKFRLLNEEDGSYCCLGVLCEVKRKISHKKVWGVDIEPENATLPVNLMKWANLDEETQGILIGFNDTKSWSFKKIAAYIKRYL